MKPLSLEGILTALGAARCPMGGRDITVRGGVVDSRQVSGGEMFVAFRGENTDGHAYIEAAFDQGATVALVEKAVEGSAVIDTTAPDIAPDQATAPVQVVVPNTLVALQRIAAWWRRQHNVTVIGVTGSVGKTTAKELIASVLKQSLCTLYSPGNYNNEIGLPLTLLSLTDEHECAVLEMGMYDLGEIALLAKIAAPKVGIVMNVEPVHLERLGTMDRIAQAKGELIETLPEEGLALLLGDDPYTLSMASLTEARIALFGLEPDNDLWADNVRPEGWTATTFTAHVRADGDTFEEHEFMVGMPGRHVALPALAAIGVARYLGMDWDDITNGLEAARGDLRLTPKPGPNGSLIIDDTYNASPLATLAAFDLMRNMPGRRIAVLGDMLELGDEEERAHREIGRAAAGFLDQLVTLGSLAKLIAEGAADAGMSTDKVTALQDKDEIVALLAATLREGDVVLIKGSRGMAMETIVQAFEGNEA